MAAKPFNSRCGERVSARRSERPCATAPCAPASSASTLASKRYVWQTRAVMSSCCHLWVRWSGARRSTASNFAMQSMFRAPRPAKVIVETYGCLAYHCRALAQRRSRRRRHACSPRRSALRRDGRGRDRLRDGRAGPLDGGDGRCANTRWASARITARRRGSSCARRDGVRDRHGGREPLGRADGPHVHVPREFRLSRRARESCSRFPSRHSMSSRAPRSPAMSFRRPNIAQLIEELAANPARMRVSDRTRALRSRSRSSTSRA